MASIVTDLRGLPIHREGVRINSKVSWGKLSLHGGLEATSCFSNDYYGPGIPFRLSSSSYGMV